MGIDEIVSAAWERIIPHVKAAICEALKRNPQPTIGCTFCGGVGGQHENTCTYNKFPRRMTPKGWDAVAGPQGLVPSERIQAVSARQSRPLNRIQCSKEDA